MWRIWKWSSFFWVACCQRLMRPLIEFSIQEEDWKMMLCMRASSSSKRRRLLRSSSFRLCTSRLTSCKLTSMYCKDFSSSSRLMSLITFPRFIMSGSGLYAQGGGGAMEKPCSIIMSCNLCFVVVAAAAAVVVVVVPPAADVAAAPDLSCCTLSIRFATWEELSPSSLQFECCCCRLRLKEESAAGAGLAVPAAAAAIPSWKSVMGSLHAPMLA